MAARRRGHALWLIRAGDTAWSIDGRLQGSADLPLATGAREELEAQFAILPPDRVATVHHPTDEAATETGKLAARAFRARAAAVEELGDPNLGLLEGLAIATFAERYPTRHRQWESDPLTLAPPEGEPIADARARVLHALVRLIARSRGAELAVVLHPLALGLVRCVLAGAPTSAAWEMLDKRDRIERYILPADAGVRLAAAADVAVES